ncbi:MAG: 50S ribosomal protein L18 [Thermodesulfobacteriota bacterium]
MGSTNQKKTARLKRKRSIRKRLAGTPQRPRLCVFRSASHIYAQAIDDVKGHTLVAASSTEKTVRDHGAFKNKTEQAVFIGELIGRRAIEKGIQQVVFDRNGFLYHGRIKAVSDGARKAGLNF